MLNKLVAAFDSPTSEGVICSWYNCVYIQKLVMVAVGHTVLRRQDRTVTRRHAGWSHQPIQHRFRRRRGVPVLMTMSYDFVVTATRPLTLKRQISSAGESLHHLGDTCFARA